MLNQILDDQIISEQLLIKCLGYTVTILTAIVKGQRKKISIKQTGD